MTLDVTFTTPSNGPDAIGRLPDGRAIFTPFVIPGETARVAIVEEKPHYVRARLVEVIAPSPARVVPVCKHFGACGGCHHQHMNDDAQRQWKRQVVIDQLARIGGIDNPPVLETLPAPEPLYYRNHVQFSQAPDGRLGFARLHSREVLPITECHIARPEIMALFSQLDLETLDLDRVSVRAGADDELMLIFESESGAPPEVELELPISIAALNKDGEAVTLIGSDHLVQEVEGRAFRVSPGSFFQASAAQAGALVRLALEALRLDGESQVLDLYCGVGLFAAFIAPRAARVIGVESFSPAVRDAEVNLDEFDNVALYEAPVEAALQHLLDDPGLRAAGGTLRVLLDPPRAGCDKAVTAALVALAAPRLVYVSCDPATLARDARRLIAGGYRLTSARPIDMFPQTHHIETLAVFER